jgi:hypothetical protein
VGASRQERETNAVTGWVEQLYTTAGDVQMKHEVFFSPHRLFFATHVRGLGVMFFQEAAAPRAAG